jgi:hypothetical protein
MPKLPKMTKEEFREKELEILRAAVDTKEKEKAKKTVDSPEVKKIISIVEAFLKKKKLICYGGTAINNILPKEDQFYDKELEIPDYDFFSPSAFDDAKELADIYVSKGYKEVEAKSGVHLGTFKVFVNFIPVADVTQLDPELFKRIQKDAITKEGILYSPPNLLRMNMYLELSRPAGDVSRWEKVLKRLILLNKNYPLRGRKCNTETFQRSFEGTDKYSAKEIYRVVREEFIRQGVVFFGGYANHLYGQYMPEKAKHVGAGLPDFDVLSTTPEKSADNVKKALTKAKIPDVTIHKRDGIHELLAEHIEVKVGDDTIAFIYKPLACHSYNALKSKGNTIKVATIDTMLNLYLSFMFADREYYDTDRILCMAEYLFRVQAANRLEQRHVLKRFSTDCYGTQLTLEDMRAEKAEAFKRLKRGTREYDEHFLRYRPSESVKPKTKKANKSGKSAGKTRKSTTKKSTGKKSNNK